MKKISVLAAAVLFAGASIVSAEGFKLNGYIRAGWADTIDDNDVDGDTTTSNTKTWLAGDYFGGSTRSRLNLSWSNKDETAGAFVRLQYTGAAKNWDLTDSTEYAYAWVKPFDGKLTVAAGKLADDWIGSDGYEGFSVIDGKSGFFAGVSPVEGLTLGGGAVVDYLRNAYKDVTVPYLTVTDIYGNEVSYGEKPLFEYNEETGRWEQKRVKTESLKADKRLGYIGGKYTNDFVTADAGFAFAGEFYANVNITPVDGLLLAFEYKHDSDDILDEGTSYDTAEHTFVEQVEYTGIENLLFGVESYQFINDHTITYYDEKKNEEVDNDNILITITPYARYEFSEVFAASVESTIYINDWDKGDAPDNYATIVPAVYLKVADGAEASVWGKISTDTDQENHQIGTGVIFKF